MARHIERQERTGWASEGRDPLKKRSEIRMVGYIVCADAVKLMVKLRVGDPKQERIARCIDLTI